MDSREGHIYNFSASMGNSSPVKDGVPQAGLGTGPWRRKGCEPTSRPSSPHPGPEHSRSWKEHVRSSEQQTEPGWRGACAGAKGDGGGTARPVSGEVRAIPPQQTHIQGFQTSGPLHSVKYFLYHAQATKTYIQVKSHEMTLLFSVPNAQGQLLIF